MPILSSLYTPPPALGNGHVQTIFPALFRKAPLITRERERLKIPDGDFLDLDWNTDSQSDRLAILSHGLEGNSRNPYVQGMAAALSRAGWDVLAWNFRGCSGEPNRLPSSYHSGATEDLDCVLQHALASKRYGEVALVGFSMGGNLILKYLGDRGTSLDPCLKAAVAFSAPCDLASSARKLEGWIQGLYMRKFLASLRVKIRQKMRAFPGKLDDTGLDEMRTFREFDGAYTAPLHGFDSANDYWNKASCRTGLTAIKIPTLLVNAQNDPFLPPACFPVEAAQENSFFHLEMPRSGGHLGFLAFNAQNEYWSETRTVQFLTELN